MRKLILGLILLLHISIVFAQKQCSCTLYPYLKETISCEDVVFRNNAKLYWRYNCNKAWLTFRSPKGKKRIIYSLKNSLLTLKGRLGYVDFTEYPSFFLAQNNVISGCCDPPTFYLHNKSTGKIQSELGSLIYFSKEYDMPIVIYIEEDLLVILNVETGKRHMVKLPKGSLQQGLLHKKTIYSENLFTTKQQQQRLIIDFDYKDNKEPITHFDIDLKKY